MPAAKPRKKSAHPTSSPRKSKTPVTKTGKPAKNPPVKASTKVVTSAKKTDKAKSTGKQLNPPYNKSSERDKKSTSGKRANNKKKSPGKINSKRQNKTTAAALSGFREHNVRSNGIRLHTGEWWGDGPVVICIHGMTANFKSFSLLAEKLQGEGCHVLAYDLRGRGRSDKPTGPLNIEVHADDLLGLLNALGVQQATLIGHSLGAFIALKFAAKYPDRVTGLVLLDGGARLSLPRRLKSLALVRQSARRLKQRYANPQAYLAHVYASPLLRRRNSRCDEFLLYELEMKDDGRWGTATPPETIEAELNSMGASLSYGKILFRLLTSPLSFVTQALKNRPYEPGTIKAPALVIRAGHYNIKPQDDFLPQKAAEKLARDLKGAPVVTLNDSNHFEMLFLEDPQRDKIISDFIRKINN